MRHTAFEAELIALRPKLLGYATRLTKQVSDAEDLVQITLMRAFEAQQSFMPGSCMSAWTMTIMRNYFYTDEKTKNRRGLELHGDMAQAAPLYAAAPEQVSFMDLKDVEGTLAMLPSEMRAAVLLAADGHSYEHMADALKIPVGTVKSRVARGRKKLCDLYEGLV